MSAVTDEAPHPEAVPFGSYQLLSLLGVGGMAKVYRGVRSGPMGFAKPVAVKLLDRHITADHKSLKALINEARLGGQIQHPNVVEIYEFGELAGTWFMAMELVDGWPLSTVLRRCKLLHRAVPKRAVVDLLIGICEALDHAHRLRDPDDAPLRLVHRDLKPANVGLTRRGEVKVLDFGVARAESNLFKTTLAGTAKGTPSYMSPEQLAGQPVNFKSDLFSLGAVLHEIVTLERPFPGSGLAGVALAMMEGRAAEVAARVGEAFPELGKLSRRLMEQDPARRPPSSGHIRTMLVELRPTLPEGPGLKEWMTGLAPKLPGPKAPGDFGDHPPQVAGNTAAYSSSWLQAEARLAEAADASPVVPLGPSSDPAPPPEPPAPEPRERPVRRRRKKKPRRPAWVIPALIGAATLLAALLVSLAIVLS